MAITDGNGNVGTEERTRLSFGWMPSFGWIKSVAKPIAWLLAAVVVFTLLAVRPWEAPVPPQEDVSTLWSESVSRLGIEPLFPPQEDFYVGDLYVVISAYDEPDGTTREKGPNRPLLRKSAKIGHIDLRRISLGTPGAPVFAPTRLNKDETAASLDQAREETQEPASGKIKVSVVSFPAITVRSATENGAAWVDWLPFSASRTQENEEVITIRTAESYGASTVEATLALNKFCQEDRTKLYCTDAFARKILGYTTNSDVLEVRNNKYVYRISLKLVTQVYLTREIDFKRSSGGGVDASVGDADIDVASRGPDTTPADPPVENASAENTEPSDRSILGGIGASRSVGTTMAIGNVIYPRPVVFGFKSVTFSLDPSTPDVPASPDNAEG